jgi:hypothetical protein
LVNVGIFYDHLEYFMAIWYHLWPFGIVCGHLLHFSQFGMSGNPGQYDKESVIPSLQFKNRQKDKIRRGRLIYVESRRVGSSTNRDPAVETVVSKFNFNRKSMSWIVDEKWDTPEKLLLTNSTLIESRRVGSSSN